MNNGKLAGWLAQDENGVIAHYEARPIKGTYAWYAMEGTECCVVSRPDNYRRQDWWRTCTPIANGGWNILDNALL